jgi:hypothetical protein
VGDGLCTRCQEILPRHPEGQGLKFEGHLLAHQ